MAIIKCKMCGGDLQLEEGVSVAECEYCGTQQTVPNLDSEKKEALFERAHRLRAACEFDKAAGVYESIVADFRNEAEAYWGLVLCKYGIEYVDDPATGKKVPTCHRSSFESVMDDPDLEQALENADAVARKVYREEAKAIEELRRDIIEVSGKEEPYDIFICYKETDDKGERTIDSVIAQDVYDALTDKGYRVFFSRITLEEKLGQEYEPYIFAALNSAKIMLAFGTDYEHYNAVWVKNEWSRYLKLIERDNDKYLIPCYKGIDAYDMPKEFVHLQGQDMGKIGAVQDLLWGIEKLLTKNGREMEQGNKTVHAGAFAPDADSLLRRAQLFLDDQEWARADRLFEQVLNAQPECAPAYVGKELVARKVSTIDKLVQVLLDEAATVKGEPYAAGGPDELREREILSLAIPSYLEQSQLEQRLAFNFKYRRTAWMVKENCAAKRDVFEQSKNLSRALRLATGDYAKELNIAHQSYLDGLEQCVQKAEEKDEQAVQKIRMGYEAHLNKTMEQAQQLRRIAEAARERDYQKAVESAQKASTYEHAMSCIEQFQRFLDYKDSAQQVENLKIRSVQIQKENETKRRRQNLRKWLIAIGAAAFVVLACVLGAIGNSTAQQEREAQKLAEYERRQEEQREQQRAEQKAQYELAENYLAAGNMSAAALAFGKAAGYDTQQKEYSDAKQRSFETWSKTRGFKSLATQWEHTVGLRLYGTVIAAGDSDYKKCNVSVWRDVVSVDAGRNHTVGLKMDGTVVAVGYDLYGQCAVSEWTNIIAVDAGLEHTVGLKLDGTVVATGETRDGQCDVSGWTGIVAVAAGGEVTLGLKSDGTVVATGRTRNPDTSKWTDIIAVATGGGISLGLKADGTVVDVGCPEVSKWTDIIAIAAGRDQAIGLKADGTVVAAGSNYHEQGQVSEWSDIVAISAGWWHTVGLKSDGTVVFTGDNRYSMGAASWTGIKLPSR
ncbi:MAG: TIR domain-containing protein [Oscillospiraceae bacterium]|nr:TIR domain-containing protein [Oscillospiraceae bacterium]